MAFGGGQFNGPRGPEIQRGAPKIPDPNAPGPGKTFTQPVPPPSPPPAAGGAPAPSASATAWQTKFGNSIDNPAAIAGITGRPSLPVSPPKPTSNEDIDKLIADLVKQQIEGAGKVDTSKEEALIKQQLEDKLGASLVGQRASMGRAGFAASGALGAMEGDIQRQARQQIAEDILGTRSKAKGEAFDRALQSIGVEQKMREAAQQQTMSEALLKMLGQDTGGESAQPTGGNSLTRIQDAAAGASGGGIFAQAWAAYQQFGEEAANAMFGPDNVKKMKEWAKANGMNPKQ